MVGLRIYNATENHDYIYGRGSADMKGGVAAQICRNESIYGIRNTI